MTVTEFLELKNWKFKIRGQEAILEKCPFCGAKDRFSVSLETGQYICNRQNSCQAKGVFKLSDSPAKTKKTADMQSIRNEFYPLTNTQLDYMSKRGISKETLAKARVYNHSGAFSFFFTNAEGLATGVKYRTIEKKIWSREGSPMTLLNWDKINTREKLYIVEGEIDMLSMIQCGLDNTVSVPNGAKNLDWIEHHYDWLNSFSTIVLIFDDDPAGREGLKKTQERLSEINAELKTVDLLFYKDLNEILMDEGGEEKLTNIMLNNEKDLDIPNIILISEIVSEDDIETLDTQDYEFNKLTGGIRFGEVYLFTGNAGSGKSTFVNNIMANLLNQGHKIYTHQGEFRAGKFKSNLYKIMCQPEMISTEYNKLKCKEYGVLNLQTEKFIDEWIDDRMVIHGSQVPSKKELLKTMEQMYKRRGIRLFFIDNLMTIQLDNADKYEEQKQLFLELQAFAKKYNVFLGIVAHPKKNNADLDNVDQYVISGASEIINLTNYAIYLKRLTEEEKDRYYMQNSNRATVGACNLKDRQYGDTNMKGYWEFEPRTGRFLPSGKTDEVLKKRYGWEYPSVRLSGEMILERLENL